MGISPEKRVNWQKFRAKIDQGKLVCLSEEPPNFVLSMKLQYRCYCGKEFTSTASSVWQGHTRSCGCVRLAPEGIKRAFKTYGQAKKDIEQHQVTLIGDHKDEDLVFQMKTKGYYRFRCRCGVEFGEKCSLYQVTIGNTKSCGCIHRERARTLSPLIHTWEQVAVALEAVGLVPLFSREGFAPPKAPARFRCTCGREHESAASDAYYGKVRSCGCRSSHVEAQLWDAIKEFAPDAIKNSRKVIAPRELDVWIPSAKLGIELDGLYWHGERFKGPEVRTDMLRKLMAVETLGARCLFFFEDEWELRQTAILGYVRSLTGTKKSIGARECKIVDGLECQEFIEKYHLQGGDGHCLTGLTLDGELVAAASFSKALPSSGVVGWELRRYCVGPAVSVIGGLSRLLAHHRKKNPGPVVTYSDRRVSQGRIYEAAGFEKVGGCGPRYWYWNFAKRIARRLHRFGFRKDELRRLGWLQEGETEWQCMQRMGYDRVWDAGKTKWLLS